ncbi:Arc family DNA-binding protein [Acidovorax sp.]|uniref:Arc family DNA-binding protein n=1 Tax=Acidovorax sp. TaxID=1872122 RepID=UPI002ACDDAFF|nr:Arc family DNA-binding protein [Acidovorax sp.]MDZ7863356.1 Arc family DNA-binding protein [Acidovorax sp.]
MSRDDPQMKIRLPEEVKARIDAAAAEAGRSLNAEIVARLESSFEAAVGYVTKEQFEATLRNAVLNLEAEQFVTATVRKMLANNVVRMFEQIPVDRRTESLANAYDFAKALGTAEGIGLEEATARIMQRSLDDKEPKALASALRRQETRLQHQIAADKAADVSLGLKTAQPKPKA